MYDCEQELGDTTELDHFVGRKKGLLGDQTAKTVPWGQRKPQHSGKASTTLVAQNPEGARAVAQQQRNCLLCVQWSRPGVQHSKKRSAVFNRV